MTTIRPPNKTPLAVTVKRACELSGLGPTSIWAFLRDGRLEAVRVRGVRRTLVNYASLARLLVPAAELPRRAAAAGRGRSCRDGDAMSGADVLDVHAELIAARRAIALAPNKLRTDRKPSLALSAANQAGRDYARRSC